MTLFSLVLLKSIIKDFILFSLLEKSRHRLGIPNNEQGAFTGFFQEGRGCMINPNKVESLANYAVLYKPV